MIPIPMVVMGQYHCYFFVTFFRQIKSVHIRLIERNFGRLICVDVLVVGESVASCHFLGTTVAAVCRFAAEEEEEEEEVEEEEEP